MMKFDLSAVNDRGITADVLQEHGTTKEELLKPVIRALLMLRGYTEEDLNQMPVYDLWRTICALRDESTVVLNRVHDLKAEYLRAQQAEEEQHGGLTIADFEKIRKDNGFSQREFAQVFGIAPQTYIQWATGRRTPPDYVLSMMAKLLDMRPIEKVHTMAGAIEYSVYTILEGVDVDPDMTVPCPVYVDMGVQLVDHDGHTYLSVGEIDPAKKADMQLYLMRDHITPDDSE
jgi:DNA-binding transcriptional regulator YiaG